MDYGLKGKVAIITGTASQVGIGKAICLTLAKEGCVVVSTDINIEGAKETADTIKVLGGKSIALKLDVTKADDVNSTVKTVLREMGKIDILINNAGGNSKLGDQFLDSKQEIWEKDMKLNLYGTMNCSKSVLPSMVERKYGKIVNFSSIVARSGIAGPSSYSGSKAAVLAFTRGLATQFGSFNINVNAIAPGMVKTNFYSSLPGEITTQIFSEVAALTPLRRDQTTEDIANAVAFLVSDVSKNITGQCLQVDSGLIML